MALLPPSVKGPLSVCSSRVRVEGQLTGATVEIYAGGTLVGAGTATSPGQTFTLSASLPAGAAVTATQTIGADTSIASPDAIIVQEKPPEIGPVSFRTPLFVCGQCVWLEGAVPGADVEVLGNGGSRGTANSYDGNARIGLNAPIAPGETLQGQQEACGELGPALNGPAPEFPAGERQGTVLPAPIVESPLRACQKGVVVSNVLPGATVTLQRSGGPNLQACFDETALRFTVNPPLVDGETLMATQEFLNCEAFSPPSDPVIVGPAEPVPPPEVHGPICVGATSIRLSNLMYGSRVRIYYGSMELGMAEAPEQGTFDFPIPPLPPPSHHTDYIVATQELCGIWSADSNSVIVDPLPESLPQPVIAEPLVECAAAVHVQNVHPGARVYVISKMLNAPIGEMFVYDVEATVPVAPLLIRDDEIFAYQVGCGMKSDDSDTVTVIALEELQPPRVEPPVYTCDTTITVIQVVPGARVDVFINGFLRGTALAGADKAEVPFAGPLFIGDAVRARQRLCDHVTELSRPVFVEKFDGRWFTVGGENQAQILAVHAAVLRTGKIVYFGGDQHTGKLNQDGDVDHTRLFDCQTHDITSVTGLPGNADLFCSGHAQLPDGRILAAGGTHQWPGDVAPDPHGHGPSSHFTGARIAYIFDPADEQWHETDRLKTQRPTDPTLNPPEGNIELTGGKWYPTLITLPSGKVMAVSGHPREGDTRHNNNTLEQYNSASGAWEYIGDDDCDLIPRGVGRTLEYPRLFVLPGNEVLSVSELADGSLSAWRIGNDANDWRNISTPRAGYGGNPLSETAVLLPLRPSQEYSPRVLLCGESTAWVMNPNSAPTWTATARNLSGHPDAGDMNPRRGNLDAVILPTGEIFVEGGAKSESDDGTGVKKAEMFDPEDTAGSAVGTWRVLPQAQEVRNYHSVALLMPNGAVWVAGSNFDSKPGLNNRNLWIEIFEPWYFCHKRPRLTAVPQAVCAGENFTIVSPDAGKIERVVLVRCGTATHNFNPDQRLVELEFEYDPADQLQVQAPPNSRIAPPGYYLLFVLDENRVPSRGQFIRICRPSRVVFPPPWWEWLLRYLLRRYLNLHPHLVDELIAELQREMPPAVARRLVDLPAVPPHDTLDTLLAHGGRLDELEKAIDKIMKDKKREDKDHHKHK